MAKKPEPRVAGQPDIDLGIEIRKLRLERGITQMELGEQLGVSFQQVQKYEKGVNRVSSARLQQIASIFKMPLSHFYEASLNSDEEASLFRDNDAATIRMLRTYSRISDKETRHQVVMLIEAIAHKYSEQ